MSNPDEDIENEQEINVDDVESNASYESNVSEIDLDGNGSCYDESETAIKYVLFFMFLRKLFFYCVQK